MLSREEALEINMRAGAPVDTADLRQRIVATSILQAQGETTASGKRCGLIEQLGQVLTGTWPVAGQVACREFYVLALDVLGEWAGEFPPEDRVAVAAGRFCFELVDAEQRNSTTPLHPRYTHVTPSDRYTETTVSARKH